MFDPARSQVLKTVISGLVLSFGVALGSAAEAQVSPTSGTGNTVLLSDGAIAVDRDDQVRNLSYSLTGTNEITVNYDWYPALTGSYTGRYGIHTKLFFYDGANWVEIFSNRVAASSLSGNFNTWQSESVVYTIPTSTTDGTKYLRAAIVDLANSSDSFNATRGCGSCGTAGSSARHYDNADVSFTYTGDTTPPEVTAVSISSSNADSARATAGDTINLSLSFDEDLATAPSVTLLGQTVTATGSGTAWTASIVVSPTSAQGPVAFTISDYADAAGNVGSDVTATTDSTAVTVDSTDPVLTISGMPAEFTAGEVFTVVFDFGESVTGFTADDITVVGAATGTLSGGPAVYEMEITPDATGNVSVSVAGAAATDLAGNASAAATATSGLQSAEAANEAIAEFMLNRARNIVQNQPRLIGLLSGQTDGEFNISVSRSGTTELSFGSRMESPVWFTLRGTHTAHEDDTETSFALASFGSHVAVDSGLLVGAMLQFDYAEETRDDGAELSGQGFLGGPYVVAQLGDQPLYFEARALWGLAENEISPFGTFTDEFDSERFLAMAALEGEHTIDNIRVLPRLQLSHIKETQRAYTDALSNTVAEQSVTLTEVAAGARFEMPLELSGGDHTLTWGGTAVWSQQDADGASEQYITDYEAGRARADIGYSFVGDDVSLTGDFYVDGIGTDAFKTYGAQVTVAFQF